LAEVADLLWDLLRTIGSIFGLFSGLIVIFRFFKDRPVLKISLLSSHDIIEDDQSTVFSVNLELDNVGDKPTTIKNIFFSISDNKEEDWYFGTFDDFEMFNLNPRSSVKFSQDVTIVGFFDKPMRIYATIDHTHGYTEKKFESYYIPDVLLDDDDEYYDKYQ
jgi:hypothetical protein